MRITTAGPSGCGPTLTSKLVGVRFWGVGDSLPNTTDSPGRKPAPFTVTAEGVKPSDVSGT